MKSYYIVGALANERIPHVGNAIRKLGYEAFDQWHGAGPHADIEWQKYSDIKGLSYKEALADWGARHVFQFDKYHLDRCDGAILVMPAGKSGHLELGYMAGRGKETYVLFDEVPKKYDVMYQFCNDIFFKLEDLLDKLSKSS